jgi:hypothetical protein
VRPIKVFYLAALTALTTMALAAPSAMAEATGLCGVDSGEEAGEAECEPVTHVHETTLSGHKAVLKTSILTVECDVLFLGDERKLTEEEAEKATGGLPLEIEGKFTYTNCGSCKVEEQNGPAEIKVLYTEHETGAVTGGGLVKVVCSGINCIFNGEGLEGTAKGPLLSTQKNGEVSFQEQVMEKEEGLFCPKNLKLDLTTTPLSPTYIKALLCVPGNLYLSEVLGLWCYRNMPGIGNYKYIWER